jgi:hypothetical protein
VRAQTLDTRKPIIFVGPYAAGPVVGTDRPRGILVQQRPELALDTSHPSPIRNQGFYEWSFTTGLAGYQQYTKPIGPDTAPEPVCVGFQVDGLDFTEIFVTD